MKVFVTYNNSEEPPDPLVENLTKLKIPEFEFIPDDESKWTDDDILLSAPRHASAENAAKLFDELPDKNIPTALVVASTAKSPELAAKWEKAIFATQLLTGERIEGLMENFRIYPLKLMRHFLKSKEKNADFKEIRIVLAAARAGYAIRSVQIELDSRNEPPLHDPPPFRWFSPSLLAALFPIPKKRLCPRNFQREHFTKLLLHPKAFTKTLLTENASPGGLAAAAALGMFIGTLPILGLHTISIIYVSVMLRLNKMMSVGISNLCMPPFVPIACVWIGHYLINGESIGIGPNDMLEAVKNPAPIILDWIVGALILAPINAAVFATISYALAKKIRKAIKKTDPTTR